PDSPARPPNQRIVGGGSANSIRGGPASSILIGAGSLLADKAVPRERAQHLPKTCAPSVSILCRHAAIHHLFGGTVHAPSCCDVSHNPDHRWILAATKE